MSRITNSNLLRLGFPGRCWVPPLQEMIFVAQKIEKYFPYFLERHFELHQKNPRYQVGRVFCTYINRRLCVNIEIYALRSRSRAVSLLSLRIIYRSLLPSLRRLVPFNTFFTTVVHPVNQITATFILNYFKLRAIQRVSVLEAIGALQKLLLKAVGLRGYRIDVTGRYGRQQRATKFSLKRGTVMLSQLSAGVDYAEDFIVLKHGKCGFKIWVNQQLNMNLSSVAYFARK